MPDRGDILAELRQVFRDELGDHVATLERETAALTRADLAPEDAARSRAEIYRAVHSLKGAARAAGYPALERFCHAVEGRVGAPGRGADADTTRVLDGARLALQALRDTTTKLAEGADPDERLLVEAERRLSGPASGAALRPSLPVPPGSSTPTSGAVPPADSMRVAADRLGQLLGAAEDLLALAHRQDEDARQLEDLDQMLGDLRHEVWRARQAAQGRAGSGPGVAEVVQLLDRSLAGLGLLGAWSMAHRTHVQQSARALAASATDLVLRSRALRVAPLAGLAPLLERAAQEAAGSLGRTVAFVLEDERLEIDRRVLDGLREPLLHLVRNAVDHGLEPPDERLARGKPATGTLRLSATVTGRNVHLVVQDDGRGIDPVEVLRVARQRGMDTGGVTQPREALALLFEPGFSTRDEATAFSGRGMGLDIVRQRSAQLHGRVEIDSEPGRGTRVSLTVPVDLSVMRVVVARVRSVRVMFVTTTLEHLRRAGARDLISLEGRWYLADPAGSIPFSDLAATLGFGPPPPGPLQEGERWPCVVMAAAERRVACRVDAFLEETEVVVKPLGARVRRASFVSGAAVLGDGEVALVLDAADLIRHARPLRVREPGTPAPRRRRLLVVDDSATTRQLERAILESAGYQVVLAHDGQHAWEQLATGDPVDLVVTDLEMPRMDGFDLVQRIRATPRTARLPVVLVTALDREADRLRALDLGANAYLAKGRFDQVELLGTIDGLL